MPTRTPRLGREELAARGRFLPEVLGENVRSYRLLRRMDQLLVADRMTQLGHRWQRNTVSEVERGRRNVTVSELLGLVVVLRATISQLLDPRGPEGRTGSPLFITAARQSPTHRFEPDQVAALVCDPSMVDALALGVAFFFGWPEGVQAPEVADQ